MQLHEDQLAAVDMALVRRLSVITGPPGSGKSSIVREIERRVRQEESGRGLISEEAEEAPAGEVESGGESEDEGEGEGSEGSGEEEGEEGRAGNATPSGSVRSALLLAPTGKAAQVMRASVGEGCPAEVFTIAMALLSPKVVAKYAGGWCTIVIDEASMVSVLELYRVVAGFSPRRLVLVGDADQLPPVGARGVLVDLLDVAPTTRLTRVFRQNASTALYRNIARVRSEREEVGLRFRDTDESFAVVSRGSEWRGAVSARGAEAAVETFVERLCRSESVAVAVAGSGATSTTSGASATTTTSGTTTSTTSTPLVFLCGTRAARDRVNVRAQRLLNATGEPLRGMYKGIRVGDPVCCDRNYRGGRHGTRGPMGRLLVSNGSMGTVQIVGKTPCIVYDGFTDKFDWKRRRFATRVSLAYAFTVHKAQGGQFDCVGVVLDGAVSLALLYTAMSRAQRRCVLVLGEDLALRWPSTAERTPSAFAGRLAAELKAARV